MGKLSEKKDANIEKPKVATTSDLRKSDSKKPANEPSKESAKKTIDPFQPTLLSTLVKLKDLPKPAESGFDVGDALVVGAVVVGLVGLVLAGAEDFLSDLVKTVKDKIIGILDLSPAAEDKGPVKDGDTKVKPLEVTPLAKPGAASVTRAETEKQETQEAVPPEAVPPEAVPPEAVPPEAVPPEAVPPEAVPPKVTAPRQAAGAPVSSEPRTAPRPAPRPVPAVTIEQPKPRTSELLGYVSRKEESAGGPGMVSSGKGDAGGVSYGTYQLASKKIKGGFSSVDEYVAKSQFKDSFKGLKAGSPAFSAAWVKVSAEHPKAFGDEQQAYAVKKYYDPVVKSEIAMSANLASRGEAIQEIIFSTSVQYGASGARQIITAALAGVPNPEKLTDVEIIKRVQGAKKTRLDAQPVSAKGDNRRGVGLRIEREQVDLIAIATSAPASPVASTEVSQVDVRALPTKGGEVVASSSAPPIAINVGSALSAGGPKPTKSNADPIVVPKVDVASIEDQQQKRNKDTPANVNRPIIVAANDTPQRSSGMSTSNASMPFRMRSGQLAIVN